MFIESKEAELVKQVSTAAPVCMLENGGTLNDGETYCPQPNVLGTCNLGQVEYENHCTPLTCANQMRGQNACDCPVCVGKSVTLPYIVLHFQLQYCNKYLHINIIHVVYNNVFMFPDDAEEFEIAGVLHMSLRVYARKAQKIEDMINDLIMDAGFFPDYNIFSNCKRRYVSNYHRPHNNSYSTQFEIYQTSNVTISFLFPEGYVLRYILFLLMGAPL